MIFGFVSIFFFSIPIFAKVELEPNPQPKEGLIRIEEDGSYIYRQNVLPKSRSVSARLGILNKPDVQGTYGQTYGQVYGSNSPFALLVDYEWTFTKSFGHIGAQAGGGFSTAQGHGILSEDPTIPALEIYNLYIVPLSGGIIYHFEYKDRQLISPFVNGGVTYFGLVEKRNDSKPPTIAGAFALHAGGGISACISCIDRVSSASLSEEYGISSLSVTAEVRAYQGLSQSINFTGLTYTGGVIFDF